MTAEPISVLVVDDEPLARKGLIARLERHEDVKVIGQCSNGEEAVEFIKAQQPKLVFLDIQMPVMNGFQVVHELENCLSEMPIIVFVTAYDEYAIKAFEIHALDYLLKPADDQRLAESLDKVREYMAVKSSNRNSTKLVDLVSQLTGEDSDEIVRKLVNDEPLNDHKYPDVLAIKDGSEVTRVPIDIIQWVDAAGDYMCVHTEEGMHIMRKTMKELEKELNPAVFVRVHRSAITNIKYVKKLVSHVSGEYHVILQNGTELKVSRSHRDKVKAAMKM